MGSIALGAMRRPSIADPRGGVIRRRGGPSPPCSPRGNLLTRAAKENIHGRGSLFGNFWGFRAASGFGANAGEVRRGGRLRLASVRARRKRALIVLGRHLLAEFHDCGADALDDPARVERLMNEAARLSGATVVRSVFHAFSPHGVSGVVVVGRATSRFTPGRNTATPRSITSTAATSTAERRCGASKRAFSPRAWRRRRWRGAWFAGARLP